MKVLAVERMPGALPVSVAEAVSCSEVVEPSCLPVSLLTDSALVRVGMPLFLPDFACGWMLEFAPYVTIGRLGKWIAPRFARRYIDGFGVAARLTEPRLDGWHGGIRCPSGALPANFDGALAPGRKFPACDSFLQGGAFDISVGGVGEINLAHGDMCVEEIISYVSRFMTLKTGDMILPCTTSLAVPAVAGSVFECLLNGQPALKIKVK